MVTERENRPGRGGAARLRRDILVFLALLVLAAGGSVVWVLHPWMAAPLPSPPKLPPPALREEEPFVRPKEDLLAGARLAIAGSDDGTWREQVRLDVGYHELRVRITFEVADPFSHKGWRLLSNRYLSDWTVNGQPVPQPLADMKYNILGPIPAAMLRKGPNVLEVPLRLYLIDPQAGAAVRVAGLEAALVPLTDDDLEIQLGPILGYAGEDFFTVTCRTSLPAAVSMKVQGKTWQSEGGYYHVLKATGLAAATPYDYVLTATLPGAAHSVSSGPHRMRTFPHGGKLVFAALGDNREGTEVWSRISAAVLASGASFAIHTGDCVYSGRIDKWWVRQFWMPAREFCAGLPCYYVIGNHEDDSSAFEHVFSTPSGGRNWRQQIGPVLLIGIDSFASDWSGTGADRNWLEETLATSRAPFVFLVAHKPAYSTLKGGGGWPTMRPVFALLEKYHATAMIAGDVHCYERSEPGRGTSMIVTAGAGAPLLFGQGNDSENPYSKVLRSEFNYCLFTVEGDTCTMQAFGLGSVREGNLPPPRIIDTCTWKARNADNN